MPGRIWQLVPQKRKNHRNSFMSCELLLDTHLGVFSLGTGPFGPQWLGRIPETVIGSSTMQLALSLSLCESSSSPMSAGSPQCHTPYTSLKCLTRPGQLYGLQIPSLVASALQSTGLRTVWTVHLKHGARQHRPFNWGWSQNALYYTEGNPPSCQRVI